MPCFGEARGGRRGQRVALLPGQHCGVSSSEHDSASLGQWQRGDRLSIRCLLDLQQHTPLSGVTLDFVF